LVVIFLFNRKNFISAIIFSYIDRRYPTTDFRRDQERPCLQPAARGVETGFGRDAERPGFVSSLFFKPFQSKADSSPLNGSETNFSGIFGGVFNRRNGARFLPPGGRFAVDRAPMPSQHERDRENARIVQ
jgi:hypothetical protein